MAAMHRLTRLDDLPPDRHPPGLTDLLPASEDDIARSAPDARWAVVTPGGSAVACCSLWWTTVPPLSDERLGIIGHYGSLTPDGAALILGHAIAEMKARGRTLAVGPMDGNTWRRYRFVTDRGPSPHEPPFFLEPDNPPEYPRQWAAAGFGPLANYSSARVDTLDVDADRLNATERRLADAGVRVRTMDVGRFEQELRRVYAVAEAGFRENFLYTPISEDEFVAQYAKVASYVKGEMVQIAEDDAGPVGFNFAVPDLSQAKRGEPVDTAIMKTLAVLPAHRGAGLGGLLIFRSYQAAAAMGFRRAIHALMHDANVSQKLNRGHVRTIRRYTLFAKRP